MGERFLGGRRAVPANYPQAESTEAARRRGAGRRLAEGIRGAGEGTEGGQGVVAANLAGAGP